MMIARGALGNPWVFEELTGRRAEPPRREEVVAELLWVIDRAEEHLGSRARRPATCASSTPGTWSALGGAAGGRRRAPAQRRSAPRQGADRRLAEPVAVA